MKATLYIGTYTSGGNSKGIYAAEFDTAAGTLGQVQLVIPQREPSYLTLSADGQRMYAVEEAVPSGRVFSYANTPSGWIQTGCQPSGGSAPCHLMLNERESMLAVANYMDGVVSFFALAQNGALIDASQSVSLQGKGTDARRQASAHAHQCVQYGDAVLVCDLGTDQVRVFEKYQNGQYIETAPLVHTRPGAGPRHLVLSPDGTALYLLCELQNTLYAYEKTGAGFVEKGVFEYLPASSTSSYAAAVRLSDDGRYLFASSRYGFHGVALFERNQTPQELRLCGLFESSASPRDILPTGDFLLCACQDEDHVQVMRLDKGSKRLVPHSGIQVPRPVCLTLGHAT